MSAMKGSTHFKEDDRLFLTLAYSVIFLPALVMTNFPWPQLFTSSFSLQLHWCNLCSTCIQVTMATQVNFDPRHHKLMMDAPLVKLSNYPKLLQ